MKFVQIWDIPITFSLVLIPNSFLTMIQLNPLGLDFIALIFLPFFYLFIYFFTN